MIHNLSQGTSSDEDKLLPANVWQARPLMALPAEAQREVWETVVASIDGKGVTRALVEQAVSDYQRTPDEKALDALKALDGFDYLVEEVEAGAKASRALALADAIQSCDAKVRKALIHFDVRDATLIRALNDDYVHGSETAQEVVQTGYVQFGEDSVSLRDAKAKDYRRIKDEAFREHRQQAHDAKRGEPVSIVVFRGDAEGTLESLRQVLPYSELIELGNLIGAL